MHSSTIPIRVNFIEAKRYNQPITASPAQEPYTLQNESIFTHFAPSRNLSRQPCAVYYFDEYFRHEIAGHLRAAAGAWSPMYFKITMR